ncbi:MAG: hypothetical protein K6G19_10610 [Lachnospiraceae bacterium]|nr:hypothetical protein [Lachnospiraceae bacterium]
MVAIDAGYKHYAGFPGECEKIGLDPEQNNYFTNASIYLGRIEENYLTNVYHRKKIGPFGLKNSVTIKDGYHLLDDGEVTTVGDIKIKAFLLPGHTLGHMAYLINDEMLFTGDSIALNREGGWCFFDIFNYDSKLNIESLQSLKEKLDLDAIR